MHIAFEGPIGSGKTTLAKLFAARVGAQLALENFHDNPFLADFYGEKDRWALPMQLWFLLDRHRQLGKLAAGPATVVSDHTLETDGVFAQILLDSRSLELYRRISDGLRADRCRPDFVVLLDARNEVLLSRIARRGRSYERQIDSAYLNALRRAYAHHYPVSRSNILRVDTSDLDLTISTSLGEFLAAILAATSTTQ